MFQERNWGPAETLEVIQEHSDSNSQHLLRLFSWLSQTVCSVIDNTVSSTLSQWVGWCSHLHSTNEQTEAQNCFIVFPRSGPWSSAGLKYRFSWPWSPPASLQRNIKVPGKHKEMPGVWFRLFCLQSYLPTPLLFPFLLFPFSSLCLHLFWEIRYTGSRTRDLIRYGASYPGTHSLVGVTDMEI